MPSTMASIKSGSVLFAAEASARKQVGPDRKRGRGSQMADGVSLVDLARSYLQAERYQVADRPDLLMGTRAAALGGTESVLVWGLESRQPEALRSRVRALLAALS